MRRAGFAAAAIALATFAGGLAQERSLRAFGGPPDEERASTRVLYLDSESQRFVGQLAIDYGRPLWREEYDDRSAFDSATVGRTIRLGKNYWTTLDTTVPLEVAGISISPGLHYLGLVRSTEGNWHLAFFEAAEIRQQHLDASRTSSLSPARIAPLDLSATGLRKDRLTISMSYSQSDPTDVKLRIEWGPHLLASSIRVKLQ